MVNAADPFKLKSITTLVQPTTGLTSGDSYYVGVGASGTDWVNMVGKIATWESEFVPTGVWIPRDPEKHIIYTVEDEPEPSGYQNFLWVDSISRFQPLGIPQGGTNSIRVVNSSHPHSSDTGNSGRNWNEPFTTIDAALDDIGNGSSLNNNVVVVIGDANKYSEDIEIPEYTHLFMPYTDLAGTVTLNAGSKLTANLHQQSSAAQAVNIKTGTAADSVAYYEVKELVLNAGGGVNNTVANTQLNAKVGSIICVGASTTAIGNGPAGDCAGTLSIDVDLVQVLANSCVAVGALASTGKLLGRIGRIVESGSPTTTVALDIDDGELDLYIGYTDLDTAWNVSGGDSTVRFGRIGAGSKTVSAGTFRYKEEDKGFTPVYDNALPSTPYDGMIIIRKDKNMGIFVYDETADLWIGQTTYTLQGGTLTNTQNAYTVAWAETAGFVIGYSATIGFLVPFDSICVAVSGITSISSTCGFVVRDDGSNVSDASISLSSETKKSKYCTGKTVIASGSILAFFVDNTGGSNGHLLSALFKEVIEP